MAHTLNINRFGLTIDGLSISYTKNNRTVNLSFDAFATCDLLLSLNVIEGVDKDANNEPVVLFVSSTCGVPRTGFALWYLFTKHFNLNKRQAEIILEYIEDQKRLKVANAIINNLLHPLKAA